MGIYIIWNECGEVAVSEFDETEEGYKKAQGFMVRLKDDPDVTVDKVILGSEMAIEDIKVVLDYTGR